MRASNWLNSEFSTSLQRENESLAIKTTGHLRKIKLKIFFKFNWQEEYLFFNISIEPVVLKKKGNIIFPVSMKIFHTALHAHTSNK